MTTAATLGGLRGQRERSYSWGGIYGERTGILGAGAWDTQKTSFWPIWPRDMGTDDVERPERAAQAFALVGGIVGCNTTPKIRRTHLNSGCWSLKYPKTWFLVYMARVDDGGDQERPAKRARVVAQLGWM
ncbi:hypothetical protein B0H10DRAFT_1952482 [Mycena sp. CBHHK59/15]|nr:hypothetical protein B0H10DRAFT_1952482 [Mycena sp. CBHHK59/15]